MIAAEWGSGQVLWSMLWFFLFFIWIIILFQVFGDIFRSKDMGGGAKTFWVILVIVLPGLGILVYLIARGGGMAERAIEQQKDMQSAQADYIKSVAGSGDSATEQISSATSLLESGAITQAEFDTLKAKALA